MGRGLDRALCLELLKTEGTAAGVHRALADRGIHVIYGTVRRVLQEPPETPRRTKSRFASTADGDRVARLPAIASPALVEGRTLYPGTVVEELPRNILKSGSNSSKIGGMVLKGRWKGMPIYTLTLEERATCPTSCGHWRSCLVPETPVLCADLLWRPLGSLKAGDLIVGFDEERVDGSRKTRPSAVEAVRVVKKRCVKITTDRGTVICTLDHQWLAKGNSLAGGRARDWRVYNWREAADLRSGDEIAHIISPWAPDTSYEAGRIRGFVEGEGCISTHMNGGFPKCEMSWAQLPGQLMDEICRAVSDKGFGVSRWGVVSGVNDSDVDHARIVGGWRESVRFVGTFRPTRILQNAAEIAFNRDISQGSNAAATVIEFEDVGERDVVEIATTTKTFIANGLAAHNCFGNKMQFAQRMSHKHPRFGSALAENVRRLGEEHPGGFVVRLHVLGDFFSVAYVRLWEGLLDSVLPLRVFGYSARWDVQADPVAAALVPLAVRRWSRFAMRFSDAPVDECSTVSIEHPVQKPKHAFLCPEQLGRTESCSTCAACWSTKKPVAFIQH